MSTNEKASFVELVRTMRQAQKEYFRDRTQSALQRSKSLERLVDSEIDKLSKQQKPEVQQDKLF